MPVETVYTYNEFKQILSRKLPSLWLFVDKEEYPVELLIQSRSINEHVFVVPASRLSAIALMHEVWRVPECMSFDACGRMVARCSLLVPDNQHCADINTIRMKTVAKAAGLDNK